MCRPSAAQMEILETLFVNALRTVRYDEEKTDDEANREAGVAPREVIVGRERQELLT